MSIREDSDAALAGITAHAEVAPGRRGTLVLDGAEYPVIVLRMDPHRDDVTHRRMDGSEIVIPGAIRCRWLVALELSGMPQGEA
jgi:hypothetical protein